MPNLFVRAARLFLRQAGFWDFGHRRRPPVDPRALTGIHARVADSRGAVIFLPSIGWDIPLRQRPHHLARELARRGFLVLFDCSNAHDAVDGFREVEMNLFLFRGPLEALTTIASPILWAFPYNAHLAKRFRDPVVVYDWIDDLSVFPWPQPILRRRHARAMRDAAVVLAVARSLHEEAKRTRPDALYVPNAVDPAHFDRVEPAAGAPVAGYYGALARWVDFDLLDEVAALRPDWTFRFAGQHLDGSGKAHALFRRPNVEFLGAKSYDEIPAVLGGFTVALIPFVTGAIGHATSPIKLYEYFAGGRPVVSTALPECEAFDVVEIARTPAEFAAALDRARSAGADEAFRERLRSIARESSWERRVGEVLEVLARRNCNVEC